MNHDRKIMICSWVERSETQRQLEDRVGFHSSTQPTYIISDRPDMISAVIS
jgi:hypothetical protein